jgi:hypothetical protein
MAKQRRTIGAILSVPLGENRRAYAWTLPEADFAFFDVLSESELSIDEVVSHRIAFRIAVHKSAWTSGRWSKVGNAPPSSDMSAPVARFMQDTISGAFSLYVGGDIRTATRDECLGLERCEVWDPEHVEDRRRDHFSGSPNKWVMSLALR